MKALSLWQPWASLVALGVKTIETRSWSTGYRGPLAIHAAARRPDHITTGDWFCDPKYRIEGCRPEPRIWRSTTKPSDLFGSHESRPLPLGSVVAICTLVGCVPIIDPDSCEWHSEHPRGVADCAHAAIDDQVIVHTPDRPMHTTVTCDQPYGDFTPGRYAWLLADIERIEPVEARGRQQLWEWAGPLSDGPAHSDPAESRALDLLRDAQLRPESP